MELSVKIIARDGNVKLSRWISPAFR